MKKIVDFIAEGETTKKFKYVGSEEKFNRIKDTLDSSLKGAPLQYMDAVQTFLGNATAALDVLSCEYADELEKDERKELLSYRDEIDNIFDEVGDLIDKRF